MRTYIDELDEEDPFRVYRRTLSRVYRRTRFRVYRRPPDLKLQGKRLRSSSPLQPDDDSLHGTWREVLMGSAGCVRLRLAKCHVCVCVLAKVEACALDWTMFK